MNMSDFLENPAVISPLLLGISQVVVSRGKSLVEKVVKEQVSAFVYFGPFYPKPITDLVDYRCRFSTGNVNHWTDDTKFCVCLFFPYIHPVISQERFQVNRILAQALEWGVKILYIDGIHFFSLWPSLWY